MARHSPRGGATGTEIPLVTTVTSGGVGRLDAVSGVAARARVVEIGWTWLHPTVWGTGVNVEAKLLMLTHAFEVWGCRRVELKTDALNERSRASDGGVRRAVRRCVREAHARARGREPRQRLVLGRGRRVARGPRGFARATCARQDSSVLPMPGIRAELEPDRDDRKRQGRRCARARGSRSQCPPRGARVRVLSAAPPSSSLVCVPDRSIAEVARGISTGPWIAHTSGATPLAALAPHERRFGLHPLQTFTLRRGAEQLDGAWAAVTSESPEARSVAPARGDARPARVRSRRRPTRRVTTPAPRWPRTTSSRCAVLPAACSRLRGRHRRRSTR